MYYLYFSTMCREDICEHSVFFARTKLKHLSLHFLTLYRIQHSSISWKTYCIIHSCFFCPQQPKPTIQQTGGHHDVIPWYWWYVLKPSRGQVSISLPVSPITSAAQQPIPTIQYCTTSAICTNCISAVVAFTICLYLFGQSFLSSTPPRSASPSSNVSIHTICT